MSLGAKSGYSLLEVLIAFAVMTLVLSVLLPAQNQVLKRIGRTDETILAIDYAISVLDSAEITGETEFRNNEYKYRDWSIVTVVSQEEIANLSETVLRLEVRVFSSSGVMLAEIDKLMVAP